MAVSPTRPATAIRALHVQDDADLALAVPAQPTLLDDVEEVVGVSDWYAGESVGP